MDSHLQLSNMYLEIARGYVPKAYTVHKFGEANDIDTIDGDAVIWDGTDSALAGGKISDYTYSTTADIDSLSSSNAGDVVDIEIQGLDTNWDLVIQTITLTGQTRVALDTPLVRVFRMINRGAVDLVGDVFCYVNGAITGGVPDDSTTVRAIIRNSHNQTQMAMFTVPAGYSLYISHGWANISGKNSTANVGLIIKKRDFGGVFRELHKTALLSAATSASVRPYVIPIKFDEKSDLLYLASATQNDTSVAAGFHGVLIPNRS